MFLLTVLAMAMRETLGVKLGFIALTGAVILVLIVEILGDKLKERRASSTSSRSSIGAQCSSTSRCSRWSAAWRRRTSSQMMADAMKPMFAENYALGATLLFWITIPIVGLVEHDAYILTFLYMIRDLGTSGVPTWPLWWVVLWSGTLGSNLTVAGAPALYVALRIAEKEEDRKVSLREFLSWSLPFTLVSSFVCYVLGDADLGPALLELRRRRHVQEYPDPDRRLAAVAEGRRAGRGAGQIGRRQGDRVLRGAARDADRLSRPSAGRLRDARRARADDQEDGRQVSWSSSSARQRRRAISCETVHVTSDYPEEGILKIARKKKCDLIVMATHGQGGMRGIFIGSVTQKVLNQSKIPVMVLR